MKSIFFVPVYNQIKEFPALLEDLQKCKSCSKILLVNNASTDGSENYVRKSGFEYLDLPVNYGIGYSNILALDWALERNYDIFGLIAGNGKMLVSEMDKVLVPILNNEADFVTGSRFLKGGNSPNLPLFRRLSIPLVNLIVNVIIGTNLSDATCGYRAFLLDIIRKAKFNWHAKWLYTYAFEYYIYAKVILNKKIRWKEVPITMRYPQRKSRYSKMRPFIDWWPMIKPWIMARIDGEKIDW